MDTPSNFDFLAEHDPTIARLGALAEHYCLDDPNTSLIKLRQFAEALALHALRFSGLEEGGQPSFFEIIRYLEDSGEYTRVITGFLHNIRKIGNDAAHKQHDSQRDALDHLKMAFDLATQMHRIFTQGAGPPPPPFRDPLEGPDTRAQPNTELSDRGLNDLSSLSVLMSSIDADVAAPDQLATVPSISSSVEIPLRGESTHGWSMSVRLGIFGLLMIGVLTVLVWVFSATNEDDTLVTATQHSGTQELPSMALLRGGKFQVGLSPKDVEAQFALCRQMREAGTVQKCNSLWWRHESPQREIELADFWIDLTEVSRQDWAQCVSVGICNVTSSCSKSNIGLDGGNSRLPQVCLLRKEARTYCQWKGKRLPTEAEWERAAKGSEGKRIWSWGNEFDPTRLSYNETRKAKTSKFVSVDDIAIGATPEGVLHLCGNVYEWVEDDFVCPDDPDCKRAGWATAKGGGAFRARTTSRKGIKSYLGPNNVGFRCAISADDHESLGKQ